MAYTFLAAESFFLLGVVSLIFGALPVFGGALVFVVVAVLGFDSLPLPSF
jgi:hypothetical protein